MTTFHAAVHGLLEEDGRMLAVRRSAQNRYRPLHWDLPGGGVQTGETVEQALVREFAEETALHVSPLWPIFVHTNIAELPGRQTVQLVFRCKRIGEDSIRLAPEEHDSFRWVRSFDDLDGALMPFLAALRDHLRQRITGLDSPWTQAGPLPDLRADLQSKVESLFRDPRANHGWDIEGTFKLLADLADDLAAGGARDRSVVLQALIEEYEGLFLHTILHDPRFADRFRHCKARHLPIEH